MPNLPVTVDRDFYDAMASATSEPYADSYLSGAELYAGKLLPMTHIAWDRLRENPRAMRVISDAGVKLVEPPYFDAAKNVRFQPKNQR